jgi:hypothetical protein
MEIDQPVEAGPQSAEGAVVFRAHAYRKWADGSRTAIPGDELVWRSSIDGAVGVGDAFGARLSPGRHTITLSRSGEEGAGASVEVEVSE